MRSLIPAVLVFIAASSTPLAAQDMEDMNTVVMNSWMCDYGALGELQEKAASLWVPAMQEVQDGGKWVYSQVLVHDWGDEWNLIFYTRAADIPTFLDGWSEYVSLLNQRDPDGFEWFTERCHEHKDNFYRSAAQTAIPTP